MHSRARRRRRGRLGAAGRAGRHRGALQLVGLPGQPGRRHPSRRDPVPLRLRDAGGIRRRGRQHQARRFRSQQLLDLGRARHDHVHLRAGHARLAAALARRMAVASPGCRGTALPAAGLPLRGGTGILHAGAATLGCAGIRARAMGAGWCRTVGTAAQRGRIGPAAVARRERLRRTRTLQRVQAIPARRAGRPSWCNSCRVTGPP